MPIHKTPSGKWKWGKSGKEYDKKEDAEKQMRAIYASGYKEEAEFPTFKEYLKVQEEDRDGEYEQSYRNKEKPNLELLFGKKKEKPVKSIDKNTQAKINYRLKKLNGYLEPGLRRKYEREIKELKGNL